LNKDELSLLFDHAKEEILKRIIGQYGLPSQFVFFTDNGDHKVFQTPWRTEKEMATGMMQAQKLSREMNARAVVSVAEGETLLTLVAHNGIDTKFCAWKPIRIRKGKNKGKVTDLARYCLDGWVDKATLPEIGFDKLIGNLIETDPKIEQSGMTIH
jgi:hypothetical protein